MTPMHDLDGWTIVFDLDGTLVDSAPDLMNALNHVLAEEGLAPLARSAARHLVGHGARALLIKGFDEAGAAWDAARDQHLYDRFIAYYRAHIADDGRPFPHVVETIEALATRGATLAVATNKRTDLALELMQALDLTRHFKVIHGADAVSACKPDAAHILETVAACGGDARRAIMVGDSITDTTAARNANTPCVVVSFGYRDRPADELGGHVVIDGYDAFEAALDGLIAAPVKACAAP